MAILPEWQGKENLALCLLKRVESDAKSENCSLLTLDTTKYLKRAHQFYEKIGFQKTGKMGDFFGAVVCEYAKKI